MTADAIFFNRILFLTALSRDIRFGTAKHIPSHTAKQLAKLSMKIVELYDIGGFVVHNLPMDEEFEKVKPNVELIDINISAVRKHVG